jgi:predicted metalloprotease with PDZ domain
MRIKAVAISLLTVVAGSVAGGQVAAKSKANSAVQVQTNSVVKTPVAAARAKSVRMLSVSRPARALIGISTEAATGPQDTLGLLVSTVNPDSPAATAGIEEGNRIAAVNGVSLRVLPQDLGDPDMQGLMSHRLTRELAKVEPGDEVDLRVFSDGSTRQVKVKAAERESMYNLINSISFISDKKASLGIGVTATGSPRDTLGIFVISVDEDGPAAKAGIEEGQRIAAINGVDLRVPHVDAGDDYVSTARLNRLDRELTKIDAGDTVELRVFANGQSRTIRVAAVAASDLSSHHAMKIFGDGATVIQTSPPRHITIDHQMIDSLTQGTLGKLLDTRFDELGRAFDEMGRTFQNRATIRWMSGGNAAFSPLQVVAPRPVRTVISM